ncbi:MAG: IreB family regulatory phosphoprotein [Bacillota bacterium]
MSDNNKYHEQTVKFDFDLNEDVSEAGYILKRVYYALEEKGYNPVNQIVGYLTSGDPAYITSYKDARTMIRTVERDDILEELITSYLNN